MYCKHCGTGLSKDDAFCPKCGATLRSDFPFITPDHTSDYDTYDTKSNRGMCFCSYLSCLALIPLFCNMTIDSPYLRFHINQGLILLLLELGIYLLQQCVGYFGLPGLLSDILNICYGPCVALSILGLVNVSRNRAGELPLVGKFDVMSYIIPKD